MKYRIVASDYDDTLLRSDRTVSKRTLEIIREFEQAGGVFVVVTGRMTASIRKELKKWGLSGLVVGFGGGQIVDTETGKTLCEHPIENRLAVRAARELEEQGYIVQTYLGDDLLTETKNPYTEAYGEACQVAPVYLGEPVSRYLERTGQSPYKVLAFAPPEEVLVQIARINREYPELYACYSKPYFVEITNRNTNKAQALQWVADHMGVPIDEVIAVGDSNNDLPMIAYAGLGVAVENAGAETKSCADAVTASNDEDGVAQVIEAYCLKKE